MKDRTKDTEGRTLLPLTILSTVAGLSNFKLSRFGAYKLWSVQTGEKMKKMLILNFVSPLLHLVVAAAADAKNCS